MYKIFLFTSLLCVLISCSSPKENLSVPDINLTSNIERSVSLDQIMEVDSIKTINMNGALSFGSIKKAFFLPENKILMHTSEPSTLSLFDENLTIIKQIVPETSNPFLLNQITSLTVFENNIYVLERDAFKVSVFSDDFELLRKIKVPFFCQSFKMLNSTTMAVYVGNEKTENNNGKLLIYDFEKDVIKNDLIPISEYQRKYFNFFTTYHFMESSGQDLFWDSAINKIYTIKNNDLKEYFHLNYGQMGVPKGFYETSAFEDPYDFIMQMRTTDYAFRHFNILANDRKIKITFERSGEFYHTIYDIQNNSAVTFEAIEAPSISSEPIKSDLLNFFVTFYKKDKALCFLPYEYLENQPKKLIDKNQILINAVSKQQNALLFCTLK